MQDEEFSFCVVPYDTVIGGYSFILKLRHQEAVCDVVFIFE